MNTGNEYNKIRTRLNKMFGVTDRGDRLVDYSIEKFFYCLMVKAFITGRVVNIPYIGILYFTTPQLKKFKRERELFIKSYEKRLAQKNNNHLLCTDKLIKITNTIINLKKQQHELKSTTISINEQTKTSNSSRNVHSKKLRSN